MLTFKFVEICSTPLTTAPRRHSVHRPKPFSPKLRAWKLREHGVCAEFEQAFVNKANDNQLEVGNTTTEAIWNQLKSAHLGATENICGRDIITNGSHGGGTRMGILLLLRKGFAGGDKERSSTFNQGD